MKGNGMGSFVKVLMGSRGDAGRRPELGIARPHFGTGQDAEAGTVALIDIKHLHHSCSSGPPAKTGTLPRAWALALALAGVAGAQSVPADLSLSNLNTESGASAYQATNSITASTVTVSGSASVVFHAGGQIDLKPGFRATAGSAVVTFRAATARAMLSSPVPGTSLPGPAATFSWSGGGSGATGYWLELGNSPGAQEIYGGITTSLSQTVLSIPTDGRTIYARLWTQVNGSWTSYTDYIFIAAQTSPNQVPTVSSVAPASGQGFGTSFSAIYSDPNGASDIRWAHFAVADVGFFNNYTCYALYDAQEKLLYLRKTDGLTYWPAIHVGQNEVQSTTSCSLSGLGAGDGVNSTVLTARFPETFSTGWQGDKDLILAVQDKGGLLSPYSGNGPWALGRYTVGTTTPVTLLSPATGSTNLPSSSVTLSWSPYASATWYEVYLGTSTPPPVKAYPTSASYTATGLVPGITYYWYVIANGNGGRYLSPVWRFTAAGLPTVSAVSVSPATLTSGAAGTVQVTLSGPAPTGGASITFSSTSTAFPMGGCAVTIPAGASTGACSVTAGQVSTTTAVTVTATYSGSSRSAQVTVTPTIAISTLSVTPSTVTGGLSASVQVTLSGPAPAGGAVTTVTSTNPKFPTGLCGLNGQMSIAAGATTGTCTVTADSVSSSTPGTVTATYAGSSQTVQVTVAPVVTISSVTVTPSSVASGAAAAVQVTLSGPAPAGGAEVTLTSTDAIFPTASCGQSGRMTIAAGASTGSCSITAGEVSSSAAVTVTGTYAGSSRTAAVTVIPAPPTITLTEYIRLGGRVVAIERIKQ